MNGLAKGSLFRALPLDVRKSSAFPCRSQKPWRLPPISKRPETFVDGRRSREGVK